MRSSQAKHFINYGLTSLKQPNKVNLTNIVRKHTAAMFNNTTCSHSNNVSVPCSLNNGDRDDGIKSISDLACSIIIVILSPLAVVGNTLTLAAIWKKTFQRTPFHILLTGLALTDLCTGLITQPLIAASLFLKVFNPTVATARPVLVSTISILGNACNTYLLGITVLIITLMSVERWLHMSRRQSLVTSWRGYLTFAMLILLPIPVVAYRALDTMSGRDLRYFSVIAAVFILTCFLITIIAYCNVFRIICQHQQQVQGNQSSQNFAHPAINLSKYKKSVHSILYIIALFIFCFLPLTISLAIHVHVGETSKLSVAFNVSLVCLFLSSSLNPFLYLLRMNDVRQGVKELLQGNS